MRRLILLVGAAGLVATTVAGVRVVNGLSGGGRQPATLLPSNVSAALVLDLDPALDQKLAVRALAAKLPATRTGGHPVTDADLRLRLIALILPKCSNLTEDVGPWLGKRVALAFPSSGSLAPVAVIQIRSGRNSQAQAGLARIRACSRGAVNTSIRAGYALVTRNAALLSQMADLTAASSLAEYAPYLHDLRMLRGHQIATVWGDGPKVAALVDQASEWLPLGSLLRPLLPHLGGRAVVGIHATNSYAELQVATSPRVTVTTPGQTAGPDDLAVADPAAAAAIYTTPALNPLVDTLVAKALPPSLTHLGLLGRLLGVPAVRSHPGPSGGRVLTLGPAPTADPKLRTESLAVLPGAPVLVLFVRPDVLPGLSARVHEQLSQVKAVGMVVTASGTARIRIVL